MQDYLNTLFLFKSNTTDDTNANTHLQTQIDEQHHEQTDHTDHTNITHGQIEFHNISFKYPERKDYALKRVSLTIPPFQSVVFKGKIGSGKSTMTKLLLKLYSPTEGFIKIDGHNIAYSTPEQIREYIGYVAQSPILFNRSIYDNIVYGSKKTLSKKEVNMFIESSGVSPLFETVPKGLDTIVGKRGDFLSGGQRQAVVLLRLALADQHKPILILDEPTSAMDYESKHYVIQLLKKIIQHKTCIIVSHDDDVIQIADKSVEFRRGEILVEKNNKNHAFRPLV